jgi:hypothetical protein
MTSLKYPHDRINGYVQLTDGNGNQYVVDKKRTGNDVLDAINYSKAFLVLASRLDNVHNHNPL